MWQPSRAFKENFIVAGCFLLSALFILILMAILGVWWFLPLAVLFFLFIAFQGVIFNLFKKTLRLAKINTGFSTRTEFHAEDWFGQPRDRSYLR